MIENKTMNWCEDNSFQHYKQCTISFDARELRIEGAIFERCTLYFETKLRYDIRRTQFINCDLSSIAFDNCHFSDLVFDHCKLLNCSVNQCSLNQVVFNHCMAQFFSISDSKLRHCAWNDVFLVEAVFMRLDHKSLAFHACRLDGCNFEGTKLQGLDLCTCEFQSISYSPHLMRGLKIRADQAIVFAIQMGLDVVF